MSSWQGQSAGGNAMGNAPGATAPSAAAAWAYLQGGPPAFQPQPQPSKQSLQHPHTSRGPQASMPQPSRQHQPQRHQQPQRQLHTAAASFTQCPPRGVGTAQQPQQQAQQRQQTQNVWEQRAAAVAAKLPLQQLQQQHTQPHFQQRGGFSQDPPQKRHHSHSQQQQPRHYGGGEGAFRGGGGGGGHSYRTGGAGVGHGHGHHGHRKGPSHFRYSKRHWISAEPVVEPASTATASAAAASSSAAVAKAHHRLPLNFKLVCYNVLCGEYIERDFFPRTPGWLLEDQQRRETIVSQLTGAVAASAPPHYRGRPHPHPLADADLVALQEVDNFEQHWRPRMAAAGYASAFKPRTSAAAQRADGSAIFWNQHRFELVDRMELEFAIYPHADRKDNVGLGVLLRVLEELKGPRSGASSSSSSSSEPRFLAVVNTHLLYNPNRGELKLGQMQILTNTIDCWLTRWSRAYSEQKTTRPTESGSAVAAPSPPHIALILCGDFNAMPGSTLMQLALAGKLDLDDPASLPPVEIDPRDAARLARGSRQQQQQPVTGINRRHVCGQNRHNGEQVLRKELQQELQRQQPQAPTTTTTSTTARTVTTGSGSASGASTPQQIPRNNTSAAASLSAASRPDVSAILNLGSIDKEGSPSNETDLAIGSLAVSSTVAASCASASCSKKRSFNSIIDLTGDDDDEVGDTAVRVDGGAKEEVEEEDASEEDEEEADELGHVSPDGSPLASRRATAKEDSDAEEDAAEEQDSEEDEAEEIQIRTSASASIGPLFPTPVFYDRSAAAASASSSFSFRSPPGARTPFVPDLIQSFFPFRASDTPRRISHALALRTVFEDSEGLRMRQRVTAAAASDASTATPASSISSAASSVSPRVDPQTGVPVRFRPTAHHWRFSGQVDHVLFTPRAFRPSNDEWQTLAANSTAQDVDDASAEEDAQAQAQALASPLDAVERVCRDKLAAQARRLEAHRNGEAVPMDDVPATAARARTSSAIGRAADSPPLALRVTSIYELPPLSAFAPQEQPYFVQVAKAAPVPSSEAAADGNNAQAQAPAAAGVVYVTEQRMRRVRDPGLPVPDSPSDHFPLAVKFQLL